jgi:hypothetical protein
MLCVGSCCKDNSNTFEFFVEGKKIMLSLTEVHDSAFDIKASLLYPNGEVTHSTWRLNYPVFRFDCADITNDGIPEIAVGVIKATRFDPEVKKRLFLFKLYDTCYVRPLWLGSKLPLPLVDFNLVASCDGARIRTVEQEGEKRFAVAEYCWKAFGPKWLCYLQKGIDKKEAKILLQKK